MGTPSTQWKETIPAGEEAKHAAYAQAIVAIQRQRAGKGARASRALHAKGNCGLEGELEVLGDLPEHVCAGLFAKPATYRAYVRYSNGGSRRQPDGKGDVRGVAIKVVGVEGTKIIPGLENAKTQDFLLIRTPAIPFRNADEFVAVVTAAQGSPLLLLPRLLGRLGFGRTFELVPMLRRGLAATMPSLATSRYFSAAPVCCGPYAIHYALAPHAPEQPGAERSMSPDYLRDDLAARLVKEPVVYDLLVQHYVDEVKTPIEDASVEWKEEDAPWTTVARLTLPRQDLDSPRAMKVSSFVEKLSFDPWHALLAHRPLGNIMRARNHAYRLSTEERGAFPEPDGAEQFD